MRGKGTPQSDRVLTACAVLIGGKETAANAACNAIFHSPRNRIRIIRIRGNIAEACRFIHLFAKGAIEEVPLTIPCSTAHATAFA